MVVSGRCPLSSFVFSFRPEGTEVGIASLNPRFGIDWTRESTTTTLLSRSPPFPPSTNNGFVHRTCRTLECPSKSRNLESIPSVYHITAYTYDTPWNKHSSLAPPPVPATAMLHDAPCELPSTAPPLPWPNGHSLGRQSTCKDPLYRRSFLRYLLLLCLPFLFVLSILRLV